MRNIFNSCLLTMGLIGGLLASEKASAQAQSYYIKLASDPAKNPNCANCTLWANTATYWADRSAVNYARWSYRHSFTVANRENNTPIRWNINYLEYDSVDGGRPRTAFMNQFVQKTFTIKSTSARYLSIKCSQPAYEQVVPGTGEIIRYVTITNRSDSTCNFDYFSDSMLAPGE